MAQKPSIPKGTRDFSPLEMARRNYIFDTIKAVFSLYGFQQIETPAMENLSTLMGKYGEEGDKLLFKILNSGDWKSAISHEALDNATIGALTTKVSEKGLRYDLTVPFGILGFCAILLYLVFKLYQTLNFIIWRTTPDISSPLPHIHFVRIVLHVVP